MKICNVIKEKIQFIFHKHTLEYVWIRDRIYDYENDNDDLNDFPTINEVCYCPKCGKILSIKDGPYMLEEYGDIEKFERICNVKAKEITLYR